MAKFDNFDCVRVVAFCMPLILVLSSWTGVTGVVSEGQVVKDNEPILCSHNSNCTDVSEGVICVTNPAYPQPPIPPGVCRCEVGFRLIPSATACELVNESDCRTDGDPCTPPYICDTESEPPQKCKCPPTTFFNPELNECKPPASNVFAPCVADSDCTPVPHTVCNQSSFPDLNALLGACVCNPTGFFLASSDPPTCFPFADSVDDPCEYDEDCNAVENSECKKHENKMDTWGSCECLDGYEARDDAMKCIEAIVSTSTEMKTSTSTEMETSTSTEMESTTATTTTTTESSTTTTTTTSPTSTTTRLPDSPGSETVTCTATDQFGTTWRANVGETVRQPCPGRETGFVTWFCGLGGRFTGDQPNYTGCSTEWVREIGSEIENAINNGSLNIKSSQYFFKSIQDLVHDAFNFGALNPNENGETQFFGHEIQTILGLTNNLSTNVIDEDANMEDFEQITESALGVADSLLRFGKPWAQLPQADRTKVFDEAVGAIETSALHLTNQNRTAEEGEESDESEGYTKSFAESTFTATTGIVEDGSSLGYPLNSNQVPGRDSFIKLPDGWSQFVPGANGTMSTSFVGLEMSPDFVRGNIPEKIFHSGDQSVDEEVGLNSKMLTFSIGGVDSIDFGTEFVEVTFQLEQSSWGEERKRFRRTLHEGEKAASVGSVAGQSCAYFDRKLGTWSTAGCTFVSDGPFSTTCACNHLSSFALMSQFHDYIGKSLPLQIMQMIGPGLPALFLIRHVYSDPPTIGRWRQVEHFTKILMIVFLVGNLFLVLFVDRHYFYIGEGVCYTIGLFSHLLFLTYFTFPFIHTIDLLLDLGSEVTGATKRYVAVISSLTTKIKPYSIWIYGGVLIVLPISIVTLTAVVGVAIGPNTRVYGGQFCWLDGPYIWAFYGPATFLFIMNLVLIGYMNFCLIPSMPASSIPDEETENEEQQKQQQRSAEDATLALSTNLKFSVLFFLTWWVAFYQFGPSLADSTFLDFAYPILIAVQGIMMRFIIFNTPDSAGHHQQEQQGNVGGGRPGVLGSVIDFINPFSGMGDIGEELGSRKSRLTNKVDSVVSEGEGIRARISKNMDSIVSEGQGLGARFSKQIDSIVPEQFNNIIAEEGDEEAANSAEEEHPQPRTTSADDKNSTYNRNSRTPSKPMRLSDFGLANKMNQYTDNNNSQSSA